MEQYGNKSTFNFDSVLVQNIKNSHYYIKQALDLDSVHEIIDEIYDTVDHVEPWLSGNARGPSSAFCLLYRLGQLKPSPSHIREMLDHKDSPYIRAVGFLYLRYCCNPRDLWTWYRNYLRDNEEFTPSPGSQAKKVTVGVFVRDILLDQYYFETIFPRIPKVVSDEIVQNLREMGLPTRTLGNGGQGGPDRRGIDDVGGRRPPSVKASLSVAFGQRAPNRAGARELGRGMGADKDLDRSEAPHRSRHHRHEGSYHGERERSRWRSRSRSRDGRRTDRDGRKCDLGYGRKGDVGYRQPNEGRAGRYDDDRRRHRSRSKSPRRSASEERPAGGRDVNDVFKERPLAFGVSGNLHHFYQA